MRMLSGLAIAFVLSVMLVWYIAGASVHMDDLGYLLFFQNLTQKDGSVEIAVNLLLNKYVGVVETRTYGLALLIQYLIWLISGQNRLVVHGLIALIHMLSGFALFWSMKSVEKDDNLRFLLALAWVASPFIIPVARTLHHFLYIMGPYYALILWFGSVLNTKRTRVFVGALLITCAWLLGEASIPVASVSVTLIYLKLVREGRKRDAAAVLKQAAISSFLLVAYVGYQKLCIFQTAYRVKPVLPDSLLKALERADWSVFGLFQSLLAFLGLEHIDPELGGQCVSAGLHYISSPVVVISALVAGLACMGLSRGFHTDDHAEKRYLLAAAATTVAVSTTLLNLCFFIATGTLPFTPRYAPPIFTIALTTVLIALRAVAPKCGRIVIPLAAAVSLSLSLGLCEAYFNKVYKVMEVKSRQLISARENGAEALLIIHAMPSASGIPEVDGLWPGIGGAYDHFAPDPYKGFWITRLYALTQLGYTFIAFDYREIDAKNVALRYNDVWRTFSKEKIVVAGTDSFRWPVAHIPWRIYGHFGDYEAAN